MRPRFLPNSNSTLKIGLLLCFAFQGSFVFRQYIVGGDVWGSMNGARGLASIELDEFEAGRPTSVNGQIVGSTIVYNMNDTQHGQRQQQQKRKRKRKRKQQQVQQLRQQSSSTLEPPSKVTTAPSVWSLSLEELVATSNSTASQCDHRLTFMEDKIVPNVWQRKIPRVVHVTGKTRCLSQPFLANLNKWKLENHSFYFHDEDAMDRLLNEEWPEFPQLKMIQNCMISGAAKSDLWRYLLLYRYGGIYTGKCENRLLICLL